MTPATFLELLEMIQHDDFLPSRRSRIEEVNERELVDALNGYFDAREQTKSVLGIDIYKYSSFPASQQRLVPVIFKAIYGLATHVATDLESAVFSRADFASTFIPTGDGGFQIFDNPLQGLVFAAALQITLSAYNTSILYPRLRKFVGPLTTRYALTHDVVFKMDDNWFGSAIISNARILSCDHLNRFLVDKHVVEWFEMNIGSIESLVIQQLPDVQRITGKTPKATDVASSLLFASRGQGQIPENSFRSVDLLRIGTVTAKSQPLDVYNLHLQVFVTHLLADAGIDQNMLVTVGNLNTAGISA